MDPLGRICLAKSSRDRALPLQKSGPSMSRCCGLWSRGHKPFDTQCQNLEAHNLKPCLASNPESIKHHFGAKYADVGYVCRASVLGVVNAVLGRYLLSGYLDPSETKHKILEPKPSTSRYLHNEVLGSHHPATYGL